MITVGTILEVARCSQCNSLIASTNCYVRTYGKEYKCIYDLIVENGTQYGFDFMDREILYFSVYDDNYFFTMKEEF